MIEDLDADGHAKIDNTGGAFMPACVQRLSETPLGWTYSIAHYFEQNGDLCCDPDVTFLHVTRGKDSGRVFPLTFEQQGGAGARYDRAAWFDSDDHLRWYPKLQRSIALFCNTVWMENIKQQQYAGSLRRAATATAGG